MSTGRDHRSCTARRGARGARGRGAGVRLGHRRHRTRGQPGRADATGARLTGARLDLEACMRTTAERIAWGLVLVVFALTATAVTVAAPFDSSLSEVSGGGLLVPAIAFP